CHSHAAYENGYAFGRSWLHKRGNVLNPCCRSGTAAIRRRLPWVRRRTMTVQLGETAPDFEAETTQGKIRFHEWLGDSWAVLFSHPKDFTPVFPPQLGYIAKIKPELHRRHRRYGEDQARVGQARCQDHRLERRSGG